MPELKSEPLPSRSRLAADLEPSTFDRDKLEVDAIFTAGASVKRRTWLGKERVERLSMETEHARLDRLNNGAPLLKDHDAWSIDSVIGLVKPGTARIEEGKLQGTLRFSARDELSDLLDDVEAGVLRQLSIGFDIHKREITEKDDGPDEHVITDWEPYEVSLVPCAADPGASVLAIEPSPGENATDPPGEELAASTTEERTMPDKPNEHIETPQAGDDAKLNVDEIRAQAMAEERERASVIRAAGAKLNIPAETVEAIVDEGLSVADARERIIDEAAKLDDKVETTAAQSVEVGRDENETLAKGMRDYILHRADPGNHDLPEAAGEFRGMTLVDLARYALESKGVRTAGMLRHDIAKRALEIRSGGMHSTSDFPLILAAASNKALRAAYQQAPRTFTAWARRASAPDFKEIKRLQLSDGPALLKVNDHGEFKRGTLSENQETYYIFTYGRIIAVTRQVIVNDDLDAFGRLPQIHANAAASLESDTVYALLTDNGNMADGVALFHAASHSNIVASPDAFDSNSVNAARALIRKQTGPKGGKLNLRPSFILHPTDLDMAAAQLQAPIVAGAENDAVPDYLRNLIYISEQRLDDTSTTAFYAACDPAQIDTIEYAYLEGEEGPVIETRNGFDVDGVELKVRHDFGAGVMDYRGLSYNAGA